MGVCDSRYASAVSEGEEDDDQHGYDEEDSTDDISTTVIENESIKQINALNSIGELSPYNLNRFILQMYLKYLPSDLKQLCMNYLGMHIKKKNVFCS